MISMSAEKPIRMDAYKEFAVRKEVIRASAELLRAAGDVFFPLDLDRLFAAFGGQVILRSYSRMTDPARRDPDGPAIGDIDLRMMSSDAFCTRVPIRYIPEDDPRFDMPVWFIGYDDTKRKSRQLFSLTHELAHIVRGHHLRLGVDNLEDAKNDPEYQHVELEADLFSINTLAPAPSVFRLLRTHGYTYVQKQASWLLTDSKAPFLQNLDSTSEIPDPESLLMIAYGISRSAAERRLRELPLELQLWEKLDPELYAFVENIPHRSGWYCYACHTRRRTTSLYCTGCGSACHYEYMDPGRFDRPVIGLRKNGQFAFCSECGNPDYPEDAVFCPVCGTSVINECKNSFFTVGDFIRGGRWVVIGTHRCRPTDVYCGTCGVPTAFWARFGLREEEWAPSHSEGFRTHATQYPAVISAGSGETPEENRCFSKDGDTHLCGVNDRFCRLCGKPTAFYLAGRLPAYTETDAWQALQRKEKYAARRHLNRLKLGADGMVTVLKPAADRSDSRAGYESISHRNG